MADANIYASTGGKPVEGAWYGAQRYLGGKLLAPGQDQPGHQVSNEVIAQTNPKNVAYVQQKQQQYNTTPQAPQSATELIGGYQSAASSALDSVSQDANRSNDQILADVKQQLTGNLPAQPTAPNLTQQYQGYLASYGVTDLNTHIGTLKSQIATIQSNLEAQKAQEEGQPSNVTLGVIAGRETEESRQAQVKLDSLNLQLGVATEQLNAQMTSINTIMQFTQQDYQNATTAWQNEFSVNSKVYDAFASQVQQRDALAIEVQKAAATNLQTMTNLITSGNLNFASLPPDAQAHVTQLETQAGLPVGTMANIQMSAKDRLLNVSNYRGQTTAIIQGQDGQITTQTFGEMQPIGQGTVSEQNQYELQTAGDNVASDAQAGANLQELIDHYGKPNGKMTNQEVLSIYNQNSPYGQAKETMQQINQGQFVGTKGFQDQNQ